MPDAANTTTVHRCVQCSVMLAEPVTISKGLALTLICYACKRMLDAWDDRIEYREHRYCVCGHSLDDHKYIQYDSDAPSPCEAEPVDYGEEPCKCGNFKEAES